MTMDREELLELAKVVREEAEALVMAGEYGHALGTDLCGACGDVSAVFVTVAGLHERCYEAGDYGGDGHCWVRMPDGQILDLTATQFGIGEKIYLPADASKYHVECNGLAALDDLKLWGHEDWRNMLIERVQARQRPALGRAA